MTKIAFILVLISTITHAYWNYLLKSSGDKHIFIALSKFAEVLIFLCPAIYFLIRTDFHASHLLLICVAAIFSFLNYLFLSSAYKYGDLSLVYPISRSSLIFLPILGYFFINEKIDLIGLIGIILMFLGTLVMHFSFEKNGFYSLFRNINNKGSVYAIIAAMTLAAYTLWDKVSIQRMEPFLYFYLYNSVIAFLYFVFVLLNSSRVDINIEWSKNKSRIIQVGFFNIVTYTLVLTALTTSKATYVGGLRQLSIILGVFFAYKLLGEKLTYSKLVGIFLTLLGGCLIYFAK